MGDDEQQKKLAGGEAYRKHLEAYVAKIVAEAPPLSEEQQLRVAALLQPGRGAEQRANLAASRAREAEQQQGKPGAETGQ